MLPRYSNKKRNCVLFFACMFVTAFFSQSLFGNNQDFNYKIIPDIFYAGTKNSRQTLDLYLPVKTKQAHSKKIALPLVVWIHGGGWRNGSKESAKVPHLLPRILSTGRYAGASINYRLSGEEKWPAQIHDCKAAIRWIRANAVQYNLDKERIAAWGSSAGGHLVSMLGTTNGLGEYEGNIGKWHKFSSKVQAVINYYGPSALLLMDDYPSKIVHSAPNSPESQLLGKPILTLPTLAKNASPFHQIVNGHPPFLHFHGTKDPLVPHNQSVILHQKLLTHGNSSTLISVKERGHSMPNSFTREWVLPFLDYHFHKIGKKFPNREIKVTDP